jgi:hypothetical protein
MNRDRILLKLILDALEIGDVPISTYTERRLLQNKIYLLQVAGLDLGYRYVIGDLFSGMSKP